LTAEAVQENLRGAVQMDIRILTETVPAIAALAMVEIRQVWDGWFAASLLGVDLKNAKLFPDIRQPALLVLCFSSLAPA